MPTHRKDLPELTPLNLAPPNEEYKYFEFVGELSFRPTIVGFDNVNAGILADASLLAYGSDAFIRHKLANSPLRDAGLQIFDMEGTSCFVLASSDFIIAAFRGTQIDRVKNPVEFLGSALGLSELLALPPLLFINPIDTLTDAEFFPNLRGTHSGFQKALGRIWEDVQSALDTLRQEKDRPVWFTGHSLGGALATLAAKSYGGDKVQGLYTFGSPRVGNATFAEAFDVTCVRFVHGRDLVTRVPPRGLPISYTHVGKPVIHISGENEVAKDPALEDPAVESGFPSLVDHAPIYYACKLWNCF